MARERDLVPSSYGGPAVVTGPVGDLVVMWLGLPLLGAGGWLADGDPHAARYQQWLEGEPSLPIGADPLFRARRRALEQGRKDDAEALRNELARLGVVVREQERKQYWRLTDPPSKDR
jgi:hypothetical protein